MIYPDTMVEMEIIMSEKYIALIPAYKPEPILIDLLSELCSSGFECVVVDDGGGEEFARIFKDVPSPDNDFA